MNNTILNQLPEGIPLPKFDLFQVVRKGKKVGVIAGFQYCDFATALLEQAGAKGWFYIVNFAFGQAEDTVLALVNGDATAIAHESELEEVEGGND